MAPRKGAFSGAMMRRQVDLQHELSTKTAQEAAAAEELARLGLFSCRQQFLQEKVIEQQGLDPEERDEAGFYPEEIPLEYVPKSEVNRSDGEDAEVVYRRIAIRKIPDQEGRVLGAACVGERLTLYEWDETRTWRKLQYKLRGGVGGLVYAWVMMRHPELGTLVRGQNDRGREEVQRPAICACGTTFSAQGRFCMNCGAKRPDEVEGAPAPANLQRSRGVWSNGPPQPRGIMRVDAHIGLGGGEKDDSKVAQGNIVLMDQFALSYLALEEDKPEDEEAAQIVGEDGCLAATPKDIRTYCVDGAVTYEVVHKPFIAIRGTPRADGKIVGTALFGEQIDTFGWDHSGQWRRVFGKIKGTERHVTAWVLVTKEGVGPLLRVAGEAGLE